MLRPPAHLNCSEPTFHPKKHKQRINNIVTHKKNSNQGANRFLDTDQVEDQRELRCAACLQGQSWLSGELLFCQRRDVLDEEVPVKQNNKTIISY